jgi:gas vesicle protein
MNTTTKMILGITVAAAAGAAIGMLIAPEKGTDLQKKIKEGANDLLHEFSTLLNTGKELASEFKSKIQPALEEINSEPIELGV